MHYCADDLVLIPGQIFALISEPLVMSIHQIIFKLEYFFKTNEDFRKFTLNTTQNKEENFLFFLNSNSNVQTQINLLLNSNLKLFFLFNHFFMSGRKQIKFKTFFATLPVTFIARRRKIIKYETPCVHSCSAHMLLDT